MQNQKILVNWLIILILTLGVLGGGLHWFKGWSKQLKDEAER